jgi:hypothetical protein
MKISEFGMVAGLVSAISVGGTIAAYKPEPAPPPVCEINKDALDAIKDQNKQLFASNDDLRNAISKMPDDAKTFVADHVAVANKLRELNDKITQAEDAQNSYNKLSDDLSKHPCEKPSVGRLPSTNEIIFGGVNPYDNKKKT